MFWFILFFITQWFRIWCIRSLGRFWNTKILILPGAKLVSKGPYRFLKHPNYIIVGVEMVVIPILFHAYMTAIIFPILHLILLTVRLPVEEGALKQASLDE
jgi:methyltransferase